MSVTINVAAMKYGAQQMVISLQKLGDERSKSVERYIQEMGETEKYIPGTALEWELVGLCDACLTTGRDIRRSIRIPQDLIASILDEMERQLSPPKEGEPRPMVGIFRASKEGVSVESILGATTRATTGSLAGHSPSEERSS